MLTRIAATTLGLFLVAGTGAALASEDHALSIEGVKTELTQDLMNVGGWSYVPVREFADKMGWQLDYDADTDEVTVSNGLGDSLTFKVGSKKIEYNGGAYELPSAVKSQDGSAYFPLRTLAEAMNASVGWQKEEELALIQTEQPYVVVAGDTYWTIAEANDTTADALKLRNGATGDGLTVGQELKVVVPEFLEPKPVKADAADEAEEVNAADLALLAKLVQVEAGNEPYEGKLAVANVVLNRVHSSSFPNTVKGVIYAPHQFPPAGNGLLAKATASKDSIKAAKAALSGENNVPGAVYFFNAKLEPNKLKMVTVVKKIGSHVFAK